MKKYIFKSENFLDFLSSLFVIFVGLLIGFVILLISNSSAAPNAFLTILTFGYTSMRNMGDVLLLATPIILTGLSVAFSFKTGLFNIGASGQFTVGAFLAIYIGINATDIPSGLRIILSILVAAIGGALWGAIPGFLKAYRNVHEVISCIMTNYIAMFLVNYLIITNILDTGRGTSLPVPASSNLPTWGLEHIFRDNLRASHVNIGFFIAIVIAIVLYIVLEKTVFGYELKAGGFNKNAADYAGISGNKNMVLSMMISGSIAGIAGALNYLAGTGLSMSIVDNLSMEGFTGISVAFLGLNHPVGIIFSGIFVSSLFLGGARTQIFGFSVEIVEIVMSVIIYFCSFVFLVKTFLSKNFKKSEKEEVL
ncbi:MAG: ABC transporter permease [Defluviitaleaceae bacterium]|nr:ABC transporter permease [Defluviitaleaceae bacterium]